MICSSQLYQTFDSILLLSHGRALYSGPGSFAPAEHFARVASGTVAPYQQGYNVADYLLEIASDPPVALFQAPQTGSGNKIDIAIEVGHGMNGGEGIDGLVDATEKGILHEKRPTDGPSAEKTTGQWTASTSGPGLRYATTFLTQLEILSGREWKILRRYDPLQKEPTTWLTLFRVPWSEIKRYSSRTLLLLVCWAYSAVCIFASYHVFF